MRFVFTLTATSRGRSEAGCRTGPDLARDGREHAIRLLDALSGGQRPRWTLGDAGWTPNPGAAASKENGTAG